MKLSSALLAAYLGFTFAHDDRSGRHLPKILGGRKLFSGLESRAKPATFGPSVARRQFAPGNPRGSLQGRQDEDVDGECGPGIGICPSGYCCSAEGWCGKGKDYCSAPDCQMNYASACDANQKPSGADTAGIARPKLGSVLYGGAGIYDCINPGEIALTFDDGPYLYTNDLLDKLKSYGAKATFFITGNNLGKGHINDPSTPYPAIIKRMHAEGHQIASHTWSHQNASQLTNSQFTNQMVWNEIALNSILGFFPTYMRPPYSICERNCQNILSTLGYHVIYFDLDTEGYLHDSPTQIQTSKDIWDDTIADTDPSRDSFLQIEHDIHSQVVYNLTDYILTSLFYSGYKSVTVGECLGDPRENWYRAGPAGSGSTSTRTSIAPGTSQPGVSTRTTIPVGPTGVNGPSTDGTCGNGATCAGTRWGNCCSIFGYCGRGAEFCSLENGCQPEWGSCMDSPVSSSPIPTRSTVISTRSTIPTRSTVIIPTRSTVIIPPSSTAATPTRSTVIIPTRTTVVQPTSTGLAVSRDGRCGAAVRQTCKGRRCTSSVLECLAILGCQRNYGECTLGV
ncbi:carbohydrate esterase family 4 protein [Canariomyces notabilis]|uniref:Carbohydrate esterase family 4 protein n=1 Tax=Canariomyces notabilis TaxID=2074819 RepID=A0AAN6YU13_9PEZI|nr:carbohydrate esterase family 4 protein [Canariomyces arenarius]